MPRHVFKVGQVEGIHGISVEVGVDHGAVRIGSAMLDPQQQQEFAVLFVRACWMAGKEEESYAAEVSDG